MDTTQFTVDERLNQAQLAIAAGQKDADVAPLLAEFGYDTARLAAGKALYDSALALHQKQKMEYGEQFTATDAFNAALDNARASYMTFVKVARVAFKTDRGISGQLQLDGERKKSYAGLMSQMRQFYAAALANPAITTGLAGFGITKEKLIAGQALLAGVEASLSAQLKESGEAQEATEKRDAAMDALDDWMSDYIAIARIALEERPQLLEKLGIIYSPEPSPAVKTAAAEKP